MSSTLPLLMLLCAPRVHPATLRALIAVESAGNPYAISVNRPRALAVRGWPVPDLSSQPHSATAALQLARALQRQGFTVSVGLAQINAELLPQLGMDLRALLDPCRNLQAAERILIDCARPRAPAARGAAERRRVQAALSCYNTGDPSRGIANGYVASVWRRAQSAADPPATLRSRSVLP